MLTNPSTITGVLSSEPVLSVVKNAGKPVHEAAAHHALRVVSEHATRFQSGAVNAAHRTATFLHDHVQTFPADAHHALVAAISHVGYRSIAIFMAFESTFLPIAAELGLFPAGTEAATGRLYWPKVLLFALVGSLVGSTVNYALGRLVPKTLLRKVLTWARAKPETVARLEVSLVDNAAVMIFFGRFIPGVRHILAIIAGTLRVPLRRFYVATLAGELLYIPAFFFAGYLSGGIPSWWTLTALGTASLGMSAAGFLAARKALAPRR